MLSRFLAKVKPLLDTPSAAAFLLSESYREVIPTWFQTQNRWSLPISQALSEIDVHDSEFALLLDDWAKSGDVRRQLEVGYQLVKHLFGGVTPYDCGHFDINLLMQTGVLSSTVFYLTVCKVFNVPLNSVTMSLR